VEGGAHKTGQAPQALKGERGIRDAHISFHHYIWFCPGTNKDTITSTLVHPLLLTRVVSVKCLCIAVPGFVSGVFAFLVYKTFEL
jgi:hypothetical protein